MNQNRKVAQMHRELYAAQRRAAVEAKKQEIGEQSEISQADTRIEQELVKDE